MTAFPEEARGRPIVLSLSGGKDSAATALYLTELGLEFACVFADTGWEAPETYAYLDEVLEPRFGTIARVRCGWRDATDMVSLIRSKAMFPSRLRRFCTQELKVYPIARHMAEFEDGINVVGIRAAESQARADLPEWEEDETFGTVWRPIIGWSEQDVIDIHRRHDMEPNPLYLAGASRVGCWPCIYARKAEIRLLADRDPARVDQIRELEAEITAAANERQRRKGEELQPRTFFGSVGPGRPTWVLIDDVVKWSRTTRGGYQYGMFDEPPESAGCMRWGLCS